MEKIEAVRLLHELRTSGYLTEGEFERKVAEVLGKKGLRTEVAERQEPRTYKKRHENKSKKWTPEEDEFILSHKDESKSWIAKKLGRTRYAVQTRLSVKGGKASVKASQSEKKYTLWTKDEDEFIIKYRDKLRYKKMSEILHRTEAATSARIKVLRNKGKLGYKISRQGVKNHGADADSYILANYGKMTSLEMAKNLGKQVSTIRNRVAKMQKEGKLKKKYSKKREEDGTVQVGENRYPKKYSQMG